MDQRSSIPTITRITSAQKYTGLSSFMARHEMTNPLGIPTQRRTFRESDPEPKTIGDLTPDDFGKRLVIRSRDFLGTVYGSLLGIKAHGSLVNFTTISLWQKKELTFRNDTEVVVLDFS